MVRWDDVMILECYPRPVWRRGVINFVSEHRVQSPMEECESSRPRNSICPEVQPSQGDVTNAKFKNVIEMLTQVVENQAGQQRIGCQDVDDTSRICEFLRMIPPEFLGSKHY
ncbi:hypothetical protein H5410_003408 [Solanum commersonii]|uniref:Late blight resistance protein n=1 Tax=Solanum commersonii TaxID=4109 RepID=A0A9J6B4Z3_SOLCO|nr:hypothetical protein H5410_003408 [Solanum commersonii]